MASFTRLLPHQRGGVTRGAPSPSLLLLLLSFVLLLSFASPVNGVYTDNCPTVAYCTAGIVPANVSGVCNCCATFPDGSSQCVKAYDRCTTIANCNICTTPDDCASCATGYVKNAAGTCDMVSACTVPQCVTCSPTSNVACAVCSEGYTPNEQGNCAQSGSCNVENCMTCVDGSPQTCNTCLTGYTMVDGACQPCTAMGCATCVKGNPGYCEKCQDGYTITSAGTCYSTGSCNVLNCLTCSTSPGWCDVCLPGYSWNSGSCFLASNGAKDALHATALAAVVTLVSAAFNVV